MTRDLCYNGYRRCEITRRAAFLIFLTIVISASDAFSRTWYVTPDGLGDAPTIQAGIDSAAGGDTVLVACGTYYEARMISDN